MKKKMAAGVLVMVLATTPVTALGAENEYRGLIIKQEISGPGQ